MTSFTKRVYEMLVRVLAFWTTYRELIGKASLPDQLFQELDAAFHDLDQQAKSQTSGKNGIRVLAGKRAEARTALVSQLEAISWTASAIGLTDFFMPRERSDIAFVQAGESFGERLVAFKQQFVEHRLPEDFIEKVAASAAAFRRLLNDESITHHNRIAATAAIRDAQSRALGLLARLDPVMDNMLSDNPSARSVWMSARRVERSVRKAKPADESSPPPAAVSSPQT